MKTILLENFMKFNFHLYIMNLIAFHCFNYEREKSTLNCENGNGFPFSLSYAKDSGWQAKTETMRRRRMADSEG